MRFRQVAVLMLSLGCGGRLTHVDDGAIDAANDAEAREATVITPVKPCVVNGGEADPTLKHCQEGFTCADTPLPTPNNPLNAAYQVTCDCEMGACTCARDGAIYATIDVGPCVCGSSYPLTIPETAAEKCDLGSFWVTDY